MAKKNALHPIYSDDYYRFQKMTNDPVFKARVRALFAWYKKHGCSPSLPFEKYEQYRLWVSSVWKAHDALDESEQDETVIPGYFVESVLRQFGFDSNNDDYQNFITNYLFYGKTDGYSGVLFTTLLKRNEQTDKPELFIQIFPHTRIEHLKAHWDKIEMIQEKFPGYRGKNKKRETFSRDEYIYSVYKKAKSKLKTKRTSPKKGEDPLYIQTHKIVSKKYPAVTIEQMKIAITKMRRLDKVMG